MILLVALAGFTAGALLTAYVASLILKGELVDADVGASVLASAASAMQVQLSEITANNEENLRLLEEAQADRARLYADVATLSDVATALWVMYFVSDDENVNRVANCAYYLQAIPPRYQAEVTSCLTPEELELLTEAVVLSEEGLT